MKTSTHLLGSTLAVPFFTLLVLLAGFQPAVADPKIVSTVPANGATGVSPSAAVVFTFSTAMDTDATTPMFYDFTGGTFTQLPVTLAWSVGNTVLTCTPSPDFPDGHSITWLVSGEDTDANELGGTPAGTFTTGSGGGGGGTGAGTNAVTSFVIGKVWDYNQFSAAAPTPDPDTPYFFPALTSLASNRTATAISLTLPTAVVANLTQNFQEREDYSYFDYKTNLTDFNAAYPAGNYVFTVSSNSAQQQVTVTLPNGPQPNAPQLSNYAAAQTIDPAQPFTLTWNPFTGGTSADYIFVSVGDDDFETGGIGATNALKGTATSLTIPAGTLAANSNYDCSIGFFHATVVTNSGSRYVTEAYLATLTYLAITTTGSTTAAAPVIVHPAWTNGTFGFDVLTTPNQTLTVLYTTDLTNPLATWPVLLTTNSPGSTVHISDSHTGPARFYRVLNGN